jgi:hypothetical protein
MTEEKTAETPTGAWAVYRDAIRALAHMGRDIAGYTLFTAGLQVMTRDTSRRLLVDLIKRTQHRNVEQVMSGLNDALATMGDGRWPSGQTDDEVKAASQSRPQLDVMEDDPWMDEQGRRGRLRGTPVSVLRERAMSPKPWDDCAGAAEQVERNEGGDLIPGGYVRTEPRNP